ncbi:hypothetical protein ACFFQW_36985 [Umezawaea endophytica]|uniref:Uncharacterized protein n=1 Tax=Umezawaea endophytica TaxID=1654476 RepID=A0A9X3A6F9_9PSEU|nr:hypothetical protein [Umezawaea endophytica]MCS7483343.1 hypothetical protein [Umezawaea endophytica]
MDSEDARLARDWLVGRGVTGSGDVWSCDGEGCSANEVAHEWTDKVLEDPSLDVVGRVRVALGLLDLLDQYAVAMYLKTTPLPPEAEVVFWAAYRRRLEAPESAEPVTYSLWVDWFEDPATVDTAFAEVVVGLDELAEGPLRRARRVLVVSGPVPWRLKRDLYRRAASTPVLHEALFHGLRGSLHDVYGDLDRDEALGLLAEVDLPGERVAALRDDLKAP